MAACQTANERQGIKQRGGKSYTQVQDRVIAWREAFGLTHGVETEVLRDDGQVVQVRAVIRCSDGYVVGSGLAEEVRGSSHVNKTSALENCETSALGRALASMGLHGGEFASANEMDKVKRTPEQPAQEPAAEGHSTSHSNTPAPQPEPVVVENIEDTMGIRVPDDPWVAQQIVGFVHHRHLGEHNDWKDVNADTLQSLTAADYEQIGKAWQARKKSLLNE
mgnify:CR=1 FL=1